MSGKLCNCSHGKFNLHIKPSWRIEQIVEGVYIDLCTFHAVTYWLSRFKWFINRKSSYRLEKLTKWWIR